MEKVTSVRPNASPLSIPSKSAAGSSDYGSRSDLSLAENEFEKGFSWKSRNQHAMYFIAYTLSWSVISSHRRGPGTDDSDNVPTWFHILLTYIFFAGPMLYLQVFIGQYTQKGCIVLGAMLPLAYGIGYSMLLNTLVSCSLNLYFCAAILYYTLVSMINYPTPPWMLCLSDYTQTMKRCFSRDDIDLCKGCRDPSHYKYPPCFNPETDVLSASLFQENIIFGSETSGEFLISPKAVQTVNLLVTIVIVLMLTVRAFKDLHDFIHISIVFASVSVIIALVVFILNNPRLDFIVSMFYFNLKSVFSFECWVQAFFTTVLKLNIVEGGHLLFGSYMPLTVNCTGRVTYILVIHVLFVFLCNSLAFLMEDYVACGLNMKVSTLSRYSDLETTFGIYPTALGIIAAAQVWATIYFLVLFSMTLHTIVLQIIIIQETLSQEIIDPSYWIYTRILLLVLISSAAILYASFGGAELIYEIFLHRNLVLFCLICIIYTILFVYGFDRISDDMHFILHSPPSKYLKWSWALGALACYVILISYIIQQNYLKTMPLNVTVVVVIFLPLPIGFLYKLFKAVKAKELSSLIKPAREFGPADIEERANRRLFNPRYEVRFRRTRNSCKHRCLLGSVTLRKCLEKELHLLNQVLVELSEKEEERERKKDFLEALRKHREIMTNALHFNPGKEYFRNRKSEFKYD